VTIGADPNRAYRQRTLPEGVSELDLDLLTAIARIQQIEREGVDTCGGIILDRIFTCDAPRLRRHVSASALAWANEVAPV
jgi:hypothetical protein